MAPRSTLRSFLVRVAPLGLVGAFVASAAVACSSTSDPAKTPAADGGADPCPRTEPAVKPLGAPRTPRWAFEPWISKDISTRDDTYAFVDGFRERGIPVGAVVIDSPWETSYNSFVPNPSRYADMPGMIRDMHQRGVRVVLWVTQMNNDQSFDFEPGGDLYSGPSPSFEEGQRCNYYLDDGQTWQWWKGSGAAVDFFNPSARAFWHEQQNAILNAGIDGWKLDFGESYILSDKVKSFEGTKSRQEYSERYYEDYLTYGRSVRGDDFVTMVRAWDASYQFEGRFFAKKEHAPVAWMGDNRRDYVGLADALDHMFVSSKAGYVTVGSDIGGYLDHDDKNLAGPEIPFDSVNFARWTAIGALNPFMQLHGRGNFTPWTVPDHAEETVALYKYWSTLHHALVPFFHSLSEEGWAGKVAPTLRPVGAPETWAGDYRYLLGDAFFVAPLLDPSGKRTVVIPAGATYYDFWSTKTEQGGATVTVDYSQDRARLPLWIREGAIVPMDVEDATLGLGDAASKGSRTVLVYPSATKTSFVEHEEDGKTRTLEAVAEGAGFVVTLSSASRPVVLRVRADVAPTSVEGGTFQYDADKKVAIVKVATSTGPVTIRGK